MGIVTLTSGAELEQFDLLAYLLDNNFIDYYDETSQMNCEVSIVKVVNATGATLPVSEGKYYNLKSVGNYAALVAVEDEFGNRTEVQINVQVIA